MPSELLNAVKNNDITAAKKLLDDGADINESCIGDTPLGIAVMELDSTQMVSFLINYKNKNNVRTLDINKRVTTSGHTALHVACNYYRSGRKVNKHMLALLFSANASIDSKIDAQYGVMHDVLAIEGSTVAEMFFYEAILRANIEVISRLQVKNIEVSAAKLLEHLKLVQHKFTDFQVDNIIKGFATLKNADLFTATMITDFTKALNDFRLFLVPDLESPKCLEEFKKSNSGTPAPLATMIANLQYHRGILDAPRVGAYDLSSLQEFIDPERYDRQKAMVELCQQQGIVDCLCAAALHPELTQQDKNKCIALLMNYEKIDSQDRLVLFSQKLTVSKLERTVAQFLIQTENRITNKFTAEISSLMRENARLTDQIGALQQSLDSLLDKMEQSEPASPKRPYTSFLTGKRS